MIQKDNWLRAAYRKAYWWRTDRRTMRICSGIKSVVAFGESLGDNLLCSTVAAGLHREGRGPVALLTPYPDLFENFPVPLRLLPFAPAIISSLRRCHGNLVVPSYGVYDPVTDRHTPAPKDHLLVEMSRSAGLEGEVELKPLLVMTPAELGAASEAEGHVLIQSSNRGARFFSPNKEWPLERWQAVVDQMAGLYPFAQIGSADDAPLTGVKDWRGRFTRREVIARLARARLFVGPEGFLMHAARAVDRRCVIVLGGRTTPEQTCYLENVNLRGDVPCSPCWQTLTCARSRECLTRIAPAEVVAAIESALAMPPLEGPGRRVPLRR